MNKEKNLKKNRKNLKKGFQEIYFFFGGQDPGWESHLGASATGAAGRANLGAKFWK